MERLTGKRKEFAKGIAEQIMSQSVYDPSSMRAEEFINHQEILETLDYAWENRRNRRSEERRVGKECRL